VLPTAIDRWYYHLDNNVYVVPPDVLCVSTYFLSIVGIYFRGFSLKVITLHDVRKTVIAVGILRVLLENGICFVGGIFICA